jgi:SAM-dependent methyltransferase
VESWKWVAPDANLWPMDIRELGQLSLEEEFHHWWIRTRFAHLQGALEKPAQPPPKEGLRVLEVGCGSAQNLRFLRQESDLARRIHSLTGLDPSFDPARIPTPWLAPQDRIVQQAEPDWESRHDVVVAMDVLEHLSDDYSGLVDWCRWLKPGGLLFVTVPAFPGLWSSHDQKLGHFRRYTRQSLEELTRRAGLVQPHTRYLFSHAFPAVYLIRKLLPATAGDDASSSTDLKPTAAPLNRALIRLGQLEAKLGGNPWFGTSVVGVFKKPGNALG